MCVSWALGSLKWGQHLLQIPTIFSNGSSIMKTTPPGTSSKIMLTSTLIILLLKVQNFSGAWDQPALQQ
jgi:hypothetical protein